MAKTAHRKRLEESNKAKTAARADVLAELAAEAANPDVPTTVKANALGNLPSVKTTAKSSS